MDKEIARHRGLQAVSSLLARPIGGALYGHWLAGCRW